MKPGEGDATKDSTCNSLCYSSLFSFFFFLLLVLFFLFLLWSSFFFSNFCSGRRPSCSKVCDAPVKSLLTSTWLQYQTAIPDSYTWLPYLTPIPDSYTWLLYLTPIPDSHTWLLYLTPIPDSHTWLLYLTPIPDSHTWLPHLTTIPDSCTWLPYLIPIHDPPTWLPYLTSIPDSYTWLPYLNPIPDSYTWLLYLTTVPDSYTWLLYLTPTPDSCTWLLYLTPIPDSTPDSYTWLLLECEAVFLAGSGDGWLPPLRGELENWRDVTLCRGAGSGTVQGHLLDFQRGAREPLQWVTPWTFLSSDFYLWFILFWITIFGTSTLEPRNHFSEYPNAFLFLKFLFWVNIHNLFTCRISLHGRCRDLPGLNEFSGVVLSCFTLSRQTS